MLGARRAPLRRPSPAPLGVHDDHCFGIISHVELNSNGEVLNLVIFLS